MDNLLYLFIFCLMVTMQMYSLYSYTELLEMNQSKQWKYLAPKN